MSHPVASGLFAGMPPKDLGASRGRLKPCPDTPNCVNSQAIGKAAIAPFAYTGDHLAAWQRLHRAVSRLPRVRITEQGDRYLRAEAASRVFGFVDDVEFLLDVDARVIHVRSASRIGYSDFGVNRQRIENLRKLLPE